MTIRHATTDQPTPEPEPATTTQGIPGFNRLLNLIARHKNRAIFGRRRAFYHLGIIDFLQPVRRGGQNRIHRRPSRRRWPPPETPPLLQCHAASPLPCAPGRHRCLSVAVTAVTTTTPVQHQEVARDEVQIKGAIPGGAGNLVCRPRPLRRPLFGVRHGHYPARRLISAGYISSLVRS